MAKKKNEVIITSTTLEGAGKAFASIVGEKAIEIIGAKLKDEFCNYTYELVSGPTMGDSCNRAGASVVHDAIARALRGQIMVQMMKLKTIAGRGKMNEVKEFVNEVLEAGEKLILFCHLHEIVDECKSIWPNAVTVTGRDSMQQRQAHIDAFQTDSKCQLIICNHKAAGVGITLTASSRVAFIEYPWTYADCVQCEDRAHRIGQFNNVMCTYFLGQDTVDERMWELISQKMSIGNTITGATDMMAEMEMVNKTLNLFNSKNKN